MLSKAFVEFSAGAAALECLNWHRHASLIPTKAQFVGGSSGVELLLPWLSQPPRGGPWAGWEPRGSGSASDTKNHRKEIIFIIVELSRLGKASWIVPKQSHPCHHPCHDFHPLKFQEDDKVAAFKEHDDYFNLKSPARDLSLDVAALGKCFIPTINGWAQGQAVTEPGEDGRKLWADGALAKPQRTDSKNPKIT